MKDKEIEVQCILCQRTYTLFVEQADYLKWQAGMHVQNAFPYLSADERELLISRTCGACFDDMFKE